MTRPLSGSRGSVNLAGTMGWGSVECQSGTHVLDFPSDCQMPNSRRGLGGGAFRSHQPPEWGALGSERMASTDDRVDLALVIPAYNEQNRLPRTLDRLAEMADDSGLRVDVLVVDDGSEDETAARLLGRPESSPSGNLSLTWIHIEHQGKGAAVRAGMQRVSAPIVGYCDADLSAGPDAIMEVFAHVRQGFDMAMGSRGLPRSVLDIRQPFYREQAGKLFNFMLRKLAGIPHRDTQCGLKLFRQHAAKQIFDRQRIDGFAFDVEVVALALSLGFTVDEIPIRWSHAEASRVSMVRDPLRMLRDVFRAWFGRSVVASTSNWGFPATRRSSR